MPYFPSQLDVLLLEQKSKSIEFKIEILNRQMQVVDSVENETISCSVTFDAESDIRTTCNMSFYVKDKSFFMNETSKFWLDKYISVKVGVKYLRNNEILWYPLGIFLLNENSYQYDKTTRLITISCADMMSMLTGLRNGTLEGNRTIIPFESNIRNVIVETITQLGNITKYIVEEDEFSENKTVPYDLEFGVGVTVYDIIDKIRNLYPAWEVFFDTDGTFIYQKIPTAEYDMVVLDNSNLSDLITDENIKIELSNVKNCIQVFGANEVYAIVKLVNAEPSVKEDNTYYIVNPDSPFTVEKIGEIFDVRSDGEYEKIPTEDLCRQRAEYEVWISTNINYRLSFESILIPWLQLNTKISYKSKMTGEVFQYIVKKIDFDFGNYTMVVEAIRFYPLYPHLVKTKT